MTPYPSTSAGDQPSEATWHPGALVALGHLRTELHIHRIYPTISHDQGQPRLVINADLIVWADQAGTVFCWGPRFLEEPAEQAPTEELPQVARRLAEPTDPP
ncbi:hypothetical protein ACIBF6_44140 [Streptosporangium amethystogenes]|uniref:hypothetical protein n=1 Tax=Streptosporangium amethystogenes TaxID=2002 RepID=UPI0037BC5311